MTTPDDHSSAPNVAYQGDTTLTTLLADQGVEMAIAEVRARLAGVAAAALDRSDDGWIDLIAPNASRALAAQLAALRAEVTPPEHFAGTCAERLAAVRAEIAALGLDGFLVPRADAHQGEYVPQRARRLAWLTGFTGSAGLAAVLKTKAAIFVDGRYTLQVRDQVDVTLFDPQSLGEPGQSEWIADNAPRGGRIGFDPWLHTPDQVEKMAATLRRNDVVLVALDANLVDLAWSDQPPEPIGPVRVHAASLAGKEATEKRAEVAAEIKRQGADATVLTAPDSIAWLLNLRGTDVTHTPLPLSFAIVRADATVDLFIDPAKLTAPARASLGNSVSVAPMAAFGDALEKVGASRVLLDANQVSQAVFSKLEGAGATVIRAADPCALPKAVKNPVELAGSRSAHRRDGVAVSRFLAWLAAAPPGSLTELDASAQLESFRREGDHFRDLSFDSISGAGSNGAIVHYRSAPETNKQLAPGTLYLIDSGAQYLDGTTDITRTIAIGTPTAEHRDRFTRVLKGHIALATARFPSGTTGSQLDVLARASLWQVGLDYDHGTGHGVGSFLSVHEGPHRISKAPNTIALKPGMIVSNEPGYYKTGAYGIRIENLIAVEKIEIPGAERDMLGFETLTLAPIDQSLVERSLLTAEEIAWFDTYHARVRAALTPLLEGEALAWMTSATAPLPA